MKTSLRAGEPRHGTKSARRENRAAKETDENAGQDTDTRKRHNQTKRDREGRRRKDLKPVCVRAGLTCAASVHESAATSTSKIENSFETFF